jgi:hypothetical protein
MAWKITISFPEEPSLSTFRWLIRFIAHPMAPEGLRVRIERDN